MMKKISLVVLVLACFSTLVGSILVGCGVKYDRDSITVFPAWEARPKVFHPSLRYERVIRNGECWIEFETPDGMYCIPCDQEESGGWAQLCSETYRGTADIGGFERGITFIRMASAMLANDDVAWDGQAILSAYGYDTWQSGDAEVPMALEQFDTDRNYVSMFVVSRSDWEWPDNGSGSNLVGFFFGDPTGDTPVATIFRVRGTFEEVTDSIGAVFIDGFNWQTTLDDGADILIKVFPIGDGLYQGLVYRDGELVWQRRE